MENRHAMDIILENEFDNYSLESHTIMLSKCSKKSQFIYTKDGTPIIHRILSPDTCHIKDEYELRDAGGDVLNIEKRFSIAAYLITVSPPELLSIETGKQKTMRSLIHYAILYSKHDLLLQLCEAGAPINVKVGFGTPLHWAVLGESLPYIRILLEYGADPNIQYNGTTPVQAVLIRNPNLKYHYGPRLKGVVYLLNFHRTDLSVLDNNGHSNADIIIGLLAKIYTKIVERPLMSTSESLRRFANEFLDILDIMFRRLAVVTSTGIGYLEDLITKCTLSLHISDDFFFDVMVKTLRHVSIMARAYLPNDKVLRDAIRKIWCHLETIEDPNRYTSVEMIAIQLGQLLGVNRFDFLCKLSIRKHYDVLDLQYILADNFSLPATIIKYISNGEYFST